MSRDRPRAVLIELSPDHGWVLYPQCLLLLDEGFEVSVVIAETNRDLELFRALEGRIHLEVVGGGSVRRGLAAVREQFRRRPDLVTINTVNCRSIRLVALASRGPLTVVLHNLDDLEWGPGIGGRFLTRLVAGKPARFLVLSHTLRDRIAATGPRALAEKAAVFNLLFADRDDPVPRTAEELRIVVPGAVCSRRNYRSLEAALPRLADTLVKERVVLDILGPASGPDADRLRAAAAAAGCRDRLVCDDDRAHIPGNEFFERLGEADFILPLIDRSVIDEWGYNRTTVPSSLLLSRAFSVPLICSTDLDLDEDLRRTAVTYDADRVVDGVTAAVAARRSGALRDMRDRMTSKREDWRRASRHAYLGHLAGRV